MFDRFTFAQIENASDRVWEALVVFEDTQDLEAARAALGTVSEADQALFEAGLEDEIRKIERCAAYTRPAPRSTRPAAAFTGPDYEGAILARQESDPSWWT